MQKLYFLALLLFSGFWSLAQPAFITGKTKNTKQTENLTVTINPFPFSSKQEVSSVAVGPLGKFDLTVPLTQPVVATITYQNEILPLFLQPGDHLEVYFNANDFLQTLHFKGLRANENNFLVAYQRQFVKNKTYGLVPANLVLPEEEFIQLINTRQAEQLRFLNQYTTKAPVSEAFQNYMQSEIAYSKANDFLVFANLNYQVQNSRVEYAVDYTSFFNQIELNKPQSLISAAYTNFLKNYLRFLVATQNHRVTDPDYNQAVYYLVKEKLSGESRNFMLASIVTESMKQGFTAYTSQLFTDFENLNTGLDLNDFLPVSYAVKEEFALGSPAPEFNLKSITGKEVTLSDFQGKMVYLNFWSAQHLDILSNATYTPEIEEGLRNNNLVLVNINVDADEKLWHDAVKKSKLPGTHLYAANKADLLQQYKLKLSNLSNAPAYYLIDTDGTFISTKAQNPIQNTKKTDYLQALRD